MRTVVVAVVGRWCVDGEDRLRRFDGAVGLLPTVCLGICSTAAAHHQDHEEDQNNDPGIHFAYAVFV